MTEPTPAELHTAVLAALDELERLESDATHGPWRWVDPGGKVKTALVAGGWTATGGWRTVVPSANGDVYPSRVDADLIVVLRNQASVVLAGRRRILERHGPVMVGDIPTCDEHEGRGWPCDDWDDAAAGLLPEPA